MKSAVLITSALAIISSLSLADTLSKSNAVIGGGENANSLKTKLINKTPASSFLDKMETKDLNSALKMSMNRIPEVSPDGTLIVDNNEKKFVTMEINYSTNNQFNNQESYKSLDAKNKLRESERAQTEFDFIETRKRANQEETITTAVYFTQIAGWSRENPKAEAAAYSAGRANGPLNITSNAAGNGSRKTQAANRRLSQEGK